MKSLSLRGNFAWTFAGNAVYTCCQWGALVILAKLGSPQAVGQFALGLAVTAPVIMFANLQLRSVLATDAKGDYRFGEYVTLRLLTSALSLGVIFAVVAAAKYSAETAAVVLAVAAAKIFESISDIYYGLVQRYQRMDRMAISMMTKGILSLGIIATVFYSTRSVFWTSVGMAAAWAAILLVYDIPSGNLMLRQRSVQEETVDQVDDQAHPRAHPVRLLQLARLSAPLGFVMLLISLNTNIPRYFVEHYSGERSLGIFAAMSYLMVAGTTVVSALGQSAVPRLAEDFAEGKAGFRDLLVRLLVIGGVLGGAGITLALLGGRWLLTALYGPEYGERHDVFALITIGAAITYLGSFLGYAITSARYFRIQVPLLVLVCAAVSVGCLALVPRFGLRGAATAVLIGAAMHTAGNAIVAVHACSRLTSNRISNG